MMFCKWFYGHYDYTLHNVAETLIFFFLNGQISLNIVDDTIHLHLQNLIYSNWKFLTFDSGVSSNQLAMDGKIVKCIY